MEEPTTDRPGPSSSHRPAGPLTGAAALAAVLIVVSVTALVRDGDRPRGRGVDSPSPSVVSTASDDDRASAEEVPLAAGWPAADGDYGLEGPDPDISLPAYEACSRTLSVPTATARRGARLTGPEDHRTRVLHVFADPDSALGFVDDLTAVFATCPEEDLGDDLDHVRVTSVQDGSAHDSTVDVARSLWVAGIPVIGLEVLHVVRRGRAVLVDTGSGEGSGTEAAIRSQIRAQAHAAAPVVAAMCRFTAGGC